METVNKSSKVTRSQNSYHLLNNFFDSKRERQIWTIRLNQVS